MGERMKPFNFRIGEDLRALIERAAKMAGSEVAPWAREALEAGARQEIEAAQRMARQPEIPKRLGMQSQNGRIGSVGCTHPPTARRPGIEYDTCTICGEDVRRRL